MAADVGAAARAETNGKPRSFQFKGLKLKLPAKIPFETLRYISEDAEPRDLIRALETIIGAEQMEEIWALRLDVDEGTDLTKKVLELMGMSEGESPASQKS